MPQFGGLDALQYSDFDASRNSGRTLCAHPQ
jgi:hypothetical protein